MQKEMGGTLDKINQQQEYMKKFKNDVYDILNNHLNDYKKLKRGIKRLHRIYVIEEHNQKETGDNDIHSDQLVKREQLEDSIEHTRKRLKNGKMIHADAYKRIQIQNVSLLSDINALRRDEVNILMQKEMFKKLYSWTKAHLHTN